jgi:hypothetical protein
MNAPSVIEDPKLAARRLMANKLKEGYTPEALHTYTDTEGNALYWRIRLKHQSLDKVRYRLDCQACFAVQAGSKGIPDFSTP